LIDTDRSREGTCNSSSMYRSGYFKWSPTCVGLRGAIKRVLFVACAKESAHAKLKTYVENPSGPSCHTTVLSPSVLSPPPAPPIPFSSPESSPSFTTSLKIGSVEALPNPTLAARPSRRRRASCRLHSLPRLLLSARVCPRQTAEKTQTDMHREGSSRHGGGEAERARARSRERRPLMGYHAGA